MTKPAGDLLGDRMKRYEAASGFIVPPRMPLILRLDGRAFHTWCRGLVRPFDDNFVGWMNEVAIALCMEAQGCRLGYVQSDEVSLFLCDYATHETEPWFGGGLQKIVSVAASVASARMTNLASREAQFDCRAFVLPQEEVCNYFIWRQKDAERNSLQMAARALYSHRQLHGKNSSALHEMIHAAGGNWNDFSSWQRRGRVVCRMLNDGDVRAPWGIEAVTPLFTAQREYIERYVRPPSSGLEVKRG